MKVALKHYLHPVQKQILRFVCHTSFFTFFQAAHAQIDCVTSLLKLKHPNFICKKFVDNFCTSFYIQDSNRLNEHCKKLRINRAFTFIPQFDTLFSLLLVTWQHMITTGTMFVWLCVWTYQIGFGMGMSTTKILTFWYNILDLNGYN